MTARNRSISPVSAVAMSFLVLQGCALFERGENTGVRIESEDELQPAKLPSAQMELVLAGTSFPVSVRETTSGDDLVLNLVNHGEVFESEKYRARPEAFYLIVAAEERYDPPLPLIGFPLIVGDQWNWSGTMITGNIPRHTTADVKTSSDVLFWGGVSHRTLKVDVELKLDANPGHPPLLRELQFWFEPKNGIVKRKFGVASVRQPVEQ